MALERVLASASRPGTNASRRRLRVLDLLGGNSMEYMARALQLASRALGRCSPNPAVGAVLVRDGEVVGEGATQPAGQAHAEIVALRAAGQRAAGSTLYVTLEPCAHYGRTPPCADALVEAGVAQAHVAMLDPSPWVDGGGNAALERAGIKVHVGAHEQDARRLNEAYLTWLQRGRPLVTGVYAIGLDGAMRPLDEASLGTAAFGALVAIREQAARTTSDPLALLSVDPALAGVAAEGVTSLNIEASPAKLSALLERGLLDRLIVFLTPTFGHRPDEQTKQTAAPTASVGRHKDVASACPDLSALSAVSTERLGNTVMVTGYPRSSGSPLANGEAS